MIKKFSKKHLIILINITVLSAMLCIWTDRVELTFNSWVRPLEFLVILFINLVSLIVLWLFNKYFKKEIYKKNKTAFVIIFTLIISSFLYINYSIKIYQKRYLNGELRDNLANKINHSDWISGTKATNLSFKEYNIIQRYNWFPKIPSTADSISYYYEYEGFLPDYDFELEYYVPLNEKVDTFRDDKDRSWVGRAVEIVNQKKKVTYYEGCM